MKHRRYLALLLAACMALAVLPAVSFADEATDVIDNAFTVGETTTNYSNWSDKIGFSGAVYAGNSAGGNGAVQLRSNNNNSGIVTTGSAGSVTSIEVVWNENTTTGRTLNVYGKNTAYEAATDLYNSDKQGDLLGTIVCGTSTTLTVEGEYAYIGLRSASGAMYLDRIEITWATDGPITPPTTYTVTFDPGEGSGSMADKTTTGSFKLPECTFTAPEGKEFAGWKRDGDDTLYAEGETVTVTADTEFVAQWKEKEVVEEVTAALMTVLPKTGDRVVIHNTQYNMALDACGTKGYYNAGVSKVPDGFLIDGVTENIIWDVTVNEDGTYRFSQDGQFLSMAASYSSTPYDAENKDWAVESFGAGYRIKNTARNDGYLEWYASREYFSGYYFSDDGMFIFRFYKVGGEVPTLHIVSFDAGEGSGEMEEVTDATSPYTLPECTFTAPEGKIFDGWVMAGGDGNVYAAGTQVTLEEPNVTFIATWRDMVAKYYRLVTSDEDLVEGETYLITSELFVDELCIMSSQTTNNRAQYKLSNVEGTTIVLDESWVAANASDALAFEFTLGGDAETGWTFYDEVTGGYLYAASSEKNWLRTEAELDDNGRFVFELGEGGAALPVAQGDITRNHMHYNGEDYIFSCYREDSHITAPVYLYRLVEDSPAVEPAFTQQSILLTGQIALRFYMDLSVLTDEQMADSYMTFAFASGSSNLQRGLTSRDDFDASHKAGDLYYFTCKTSPVQMANIIVATYHYGDGQTVERTYSIEQYFGTYDNNQSLFSEKQQAVVEAMADYGYYTQKFLVSDGIIQLGNKYAEITKHYAESYDIDEVRRAVAEKEIVKTNKTNGDIEEITYSLSLADQPIINVYFKTATDYEGDIVVKQGTNTLEVKKVGDLYRVQIKDIPAHLLGKTYTLKATTTNGTATVKVSALSYVHALLTNTAYANNEDAQNAAAAIYYYYLAAYNLKYGN